MKDRAITNLKEFLRHRLSAEQHLESGNRTPTEVFSSLNPIDRVVSMSKTKDEGPYTCLLEACSGSGKSMCAVDYFVRNPDTSLYFLFGYKHTQLIYQEVSEITNLINRALDIDLWNCIGEYTSNQGEAAALVAINISMKRSQGWHVLGVLGFLLNQTEEVKPVTVEQAKSWQQNLWVFLDEAIPARREECHILYPIGRLVLLKRILRNARIHCMMLGTNTLIMNFNDAAQRSPDSRDGEEKLLCVTHRALPPFIPPSHDHLACLERIFGVKEASVLLDNVNPWLCKLFMVEAMAKATESYEPAHALRKFASPILETVKAVKSSFSKASLYCMFQIAAHESLSQVHLSTSFALLNIWPGNPPTRGYDSCIVTLARDASNPDKITLKSKSLFEITTRFAPAHVDPLTPAICAGNGRPFGEDKSALSVLQEIYQQQSFMNDSTAVDAQKRDGGTLESFGGVVMMISSWSEPQDILMNIAFHCGSKMETRSVNEILETVAVGNQIEDFFEILTSCIQNLLPLSITSSGKGSAAYGYYTREKDQNQVDGKFQGPAHETRKRMIGRAEFKNRTTAIPTSECCKIVGKLLAPEVDLALFMISEMKEGSIEQIVQECNTGTEVLILHLSENSHWRACIVDQRKDEREAEIRGHRKVLMIVEVGLKTEPFCIPIGQTRWTQQESD